MILPSLVQHGLNKGHKLFQRLLADLRHGGIGGRVTNDQQQKGAFVGWATEDFVEKAHGARGVGEGGETGMVQRRDQYARGNAH